jgi:anaerobic magnesium-protoporphyrin IX monomethyl ester cyclase
LAWNPATRKSCKSIDKKVDHDTIRQAFKNAKEIDLETIAFMIIGLPGETRETMQRTIDFAIELDPMIANFSMMTPYPGTKVYEIVKRQGRFLINDWEDYVFFEQQARYEMGEMTAELVEEMYRKAYRQFYLRPSADHAPRQDQGFLAESAAQHAHCHAHLCPRRKRPVCARQSRLKAQFERD